MSDDARPDRQGDARDDRDDRGDRGEAGARRQDPPPGSERGRADRDDRRGPRTDGPRGGGFRGEDRRGAGPGGRPPRGGRPFRDGDSGDRRRGDRVEGERSRRGDGHDGGRGGDRGRGERPERPGVGRIRYGGQARRSDPQRRSAQRPSERSRRSDDARHVAYETLRAVSEGAYANLELPRRLRHAHLDPRDAGFATELVYGVCRMRGLYDAVIAACSGRPLDRIDPPVLDILRLGSHQLLGTRVPPHAAVGETVALARDVTGAGPAAFANAVLRSVAEKGVGEWLSIVAPGAGRRAGTHGDTDTPAVAPTDLDDVAVARSHPAWIVRALRQSLLAHGVSTPEAVDADLLDLLHADNAPAPVALVARPGLADLAELEEGGATPSGLSPLGVRLDAGGAPGAIPAVRDARAGVQDEGSQLVVLALVAAADDLLTGPPGDPAAAGADPEAGEGPRWLDLCAGPGGKAALLAALARERRATLFANDVSEHRTQLVHGAVRAAVEAGADVLVGVGDGRTIGTEEPGSFDLVLVDAPCTGLGALRRRPDARWRRDRSDVAQLADLQRELLTSALQAVRPGGIVGYVTCSPHPAETRVVVNDVLSRRNDVEQLDARPYVRDASGTPVPGTGAGPGAQLWPHVHGTDAMYLALLRRRG